MGENTSGSEIRLFAGDLTQNDEETIWKWNQSVPSSVNKLVQSIIDINIQSIPQAPAICSWDGEFSYKDLGEQSHRFALFLKDSGVLRGMTLPLLFEKSALTVVAMLATIRIGAAFVLLDAAQPEARLRDMIKLTGARFIAASTVQKDLATKIGPQVIILSHELSMKLSMKLPAVTVSNQDSDPEDMLFIVFTSGSTGTPKGVVSTHRSFNSGVHHRRSILELPQPSRVFDFASYSFDVSTDNILSTLIVGGCVCVPSDWERQNDIVGSMNRLRVNSADLTPSVARLIHPNYVPGLQVLKIGGELASAADVALWAPRTRLFNVYGPSECLLVTNNIIPPNGDPRNIGKGHGAVTWIVNPNDHHALVPVGAVGELVVEGPLVTNGYLNDPERTATVFIDPPEWLPPRSGSQSQKLYKTGDLVRYNVDGSLNFIGRKDTQVKVRGQRVELSEVEHHIQQELFSRTSMQINTVVELITPESSAEARQQPTLAGFIAMSQILKTEPDHPDLLKEALWESTKDLNKSLLRVLPKYMIPSVYIPLWEFPLSPSGKTDRRRLRTMGSSLSREVIASFRPRQTTARVSAATVSSEARSETPAERTLRTLWARVLGVDSRNITRDDHFLKLGGDSLNAIQVVAEAHEEGLALTVEKIFANPILSQMAFVAIRPDNGEHANSGLV